MFLEEIPPQCGQQYGQAITRISRILPDFKHDQLPCTNERIIGSECSYVTVCCT